MPLNLISVFFSVCFPQSIICRRSCLIADAENVTQKKNKKRNKKIRKTKIAKTQLIYLQSRHQSIGHLTAHSNIQLAVINCHQKG